MRSLWKTARGRPTATEATTPAAVQSTSAAASRQSRVRRTTRWASLLDQQVNGLHAKRPTERRPGDGDAGRRPVVVRVADVLNDGVVRRSVLRCVGHFTLDWTYSAGQSPPADISPAHFCQHTYYIFIVYFTVCLRVSHFIVLYFFSF